MSLVRNALKRRSLLAAGAILPLLLSRPSHATTILPDKELEMLVGFARNGGTDSVARAIAYPIEQRVGRHVAVVDKSGRLGAIPGEDLKKGPGDGSLVAFMASTTLVASLVLPDFPFDPLTDIAPVGLAGTWPLALAVSPKLGIGTFDEYLKWAMADDPNRHRLGSTASEAFVDAFSVMVGKAIGVEFEPKAYRGALPMVNDLTDGRLAAAVTGVVSMLEYHRGRRLRFLMTTSPMRLAVAPDVPTARELGYPQLEDMEWFALFAPPATPAPLVDEWNRQLHAVLEDAELQAQLVQLGLTIETSTPEAAGARLAAHLKSWKERMQTAGIVIMN